MMASEKLKAEILPILEIARQAPSVHNTQPWKVSLKGSSALIHTDKNILLRHSDPTGRETYISLGIFCEAVIIAAGAYGLTMKDVALEDGTARIDFKLASKNISSQKEIAAISNRSTDRSIYEPVDISTSVLKKIEGISSPSVRVRASTDRAMIVKTAELTARGIGLALSSPDFRKELSQYLVRPWSGKKRGISTNSLALPAMLAALEPWLIKIGAGLKKEVSVERRRWMSASALIFITTSGDMVKDWFGAGRAYLKAALVIEEAGLSQATSAATVEASTFHEDIESMLNTDQRLQCVLRVGRGKEQRNHSPRLEAQNLLIT